LFPIIGSDEQTARERSIKGTIFAKFKSCRPDYVAVALQSCCVREGHQRTSMSSLLREREFVLIE
jgi:hypothetical protein